MSQYQSYKQEKSLADITYFYSISRFTGVFFYNDLRFKKNFLLMPQKVFLEKKRWRKRNGCRLSLSTKNNYHHHWTEFLGMLPEHRCALHRKSDYNTTSSIIIFVSFTLNSLTQQLRKLYQKKRFLTNSRKISGTVIEFCRTQSSFSVKFRIDNIITYVKNP